MERERCGAQAREQGADTGFDTRYLVSVNRKIRTSLKMHNTEVSRRPSWTAGQSCFYGGRMNELHLFAGAGGGILGGVLLGHTTKQVEWLVMWHKEV